MLFLENFRVNFSSEMIDLMKDEVYVFHFIFPQILMEATTVIAY